MMKEGNTKRLVIQVLIEAVMVAAVLIMISVLMHNAGLAEEQEYNPLYVVADVLNGRAHPTKKSPVEAIFDYGDKLIPTGKISRDKEWVEVAGGESGTVWVHVNYVSERFTEFTAVNLNNGRIKIRSKIDGGKLKGYVKHGKMIEVDRVVLGWGHTSKGWIDLDYFIEEE